MVNVATFYFSGQTLQIPASVLSKRSQTEVLRAGRPPIVRLWWPSTSEQLTVDMPTVFAENLEDKYM